MVPRSRPVILFIVLGACLMAPAQERDPAGEFHLTADEGRRLYALSAFAHGHRHGYEEGYLAADAELQLGRRPREIRPDKVPKAMHYKREYGDRKRFREGFVSGFIAGFQDSFADRSFRLPDWTREVPPLPWSLEDLPQADGPPVPDRIARGIFDEGVAAGYRSGLKVPAADTASVALAAQAAGACEGLTVVPESRQGFCAGFTQGFLLGANDAAASAPLVDQKLAQSATPAQ